MDNFKEWIIINFFIYKILINLYTLNKLNYYPLENNKNKCVSGLKFYDSINNQGYFFNLSYATMDKCSAECKNCIVSSSNCIDCNSDKNYFPVYDLNNSCKKYPTGYYLDNSKIYRKCLNDCSLCSDGKSCDLSCIDNVQFSPIVKEYDINSNNLFNQPNCKFFFIFLFLKNF